MKKSLLLLALIAMSLSSFAQTQGGSWVDPTKPKKHNSLSLLVPGISLSDGNREMVGKDFIGASFQAGTFPTEWLFWEVGLGVNGQFKGEGASSVKTYNLRVPLTVGFSLGNIELSRGNKASYCKIGGGVDYNYLLAKNIGGNPAEIEGTDRGSFGGHVRVTLSYLFGIYGEYQFPFDSKDGKGRFNLGVCIEL